MLLRVSAATSKTATHTLKQPHTYTLKQPPPPLQATQISPWVVTMYALAPFALELPGQEPQVLPYLQEARHCSYDVQLQVRPGL
jgi:hypothetical protein